MVEKRELTFQVSGMLWRRSLVMRDVETKTLWSHLYGKAMRGPLKGTELKLLPAVMTTWGEWRERHPKTTVLAMSRTAKRFTEEVWKQPKRFVYGVHLGAGQPSPAVAVTRLQSEPVINLSVEKEVQVVVTFEEKGRRIQSFSRQLEGKTLDFDALEDGKMKDGAGSIWDRVTGLCLEGESVGKSLTPQPGTISYLKAWRVFFPEGEVVK